MAEGNFPCKLGFHSNASHGVPSVSPPLLLSDEARHLVYVFCDQGENSIKTHKHRYQRRYCSLCRHFHQETDYKDGFEKYFSRRETTKNSGSTGRSEQENVDWTYEGNTNGSQANAALRSEEEHWRTLSVEGLKLYKTSGKTSKKSISKKPEFGKEGDLHGKEERDKHFSARSGCRVCVKRIADSQEANKSNKRIIKIVLPPFE